MGLVNDDEHGSALLAAGPQVVEYRERDDERLLGVAESAEVEHRGIRSGLDDLGGGRPLAGPEAPVVEGEVLDALGEGMVHRVAGLPQALDDAALVVDGVALLQVQQGVVFGAVIERVEPQQGRLDGERQCREPHPQRVVAVARSQHPDVAARQRRSGARTRGLRPHFAEPHEGGVGVEDHQRQTRVREHLLEHDAERVSLARSALAAPEGVAVETLSVQFCDVARLDDGADGQGGWHGSMLAGRYRSSESRPTLV